MKRSLIFVLVFMILCSSAALAVKKIRRHGELMPSKTVVSVPRFESEEPLIVEPAVVLFDAETGRISISCIGIPDSPGISRVDLRIKGDPYTHAGIPLGTTGRIKVTAVLDLPEKNVVFTSTGRIYIRLRLFDSSGTVVAQATRSPLTDTRFRGKDLSFTCATPGAMPRGDYHAEVIFDVRAESIGVAALEGSYIDPENSGVKLKSISVGPESSR